MLSHLKVKGKPSPAEATSEQDVAVNCTVAVEHFFTNCIQLGKLALKD